MKRAELLRVYMDLNKNLHQQNYDVAEKYKKRPSKIEERIRMRKLRMNKILQRKSCKSPEFSDNCGKSNLIAESNDSDKNDGKIRNSSSSRMTLNSTNSSCSSNSNEKNPGIRNSKQRVDLFEIQAPNRTPFFDNRVKKSKARSKICEEKLNSLFSEVAAAAFGKRKIRNRPKSAPCTPLFQIKYPKNDYCLNSWGYEADFKDRKTVEKNCVQLIEENSQTTNEIRTEVRLKSSQSLQLITGEKKSSVLNVNSAPEKAESISREVEKIEEKLDSENPEIRSQISQSLGDYLNRENCAADFFQESGKRSSSFDCNEKKASNSRCTNNEVVSNKKLLNNSCTDKFESSSCIIEKEGIIFDPKNLINVNEAENGIDFNIHQRIKASNLGAEEQETKQMFEKKSGIVSAEENIFRNDSNYRKHFGCCKKIDKLGPEKILLTDISSNAKFKSLFDRNLTERNSQPKSQLWVNANCSLQKNICVCNCSITTCRDKSSAIESERRNIGSFNASDLLNSRIKSCSRMIENDDFNSLSTEMLKSCNCTSNRGVKLRGKVIGQRSKSSPRKVTFFLPSLIPEETNSFCDHEEEKEREKLRNKNLKNNNNSRNSNCICNCVKKRHHYHHHHRSNDCNLNKFGPEMNERWKNSSVNFMNSFNHFEHEKKLERSQENNKWRNSRTHFSCCKKEIACKDGPIDQGEISIDKRSASGTSLTSDKDWADDNNVDENHSNILENISFPKETRQAMNVLMQLRENKAAINHNPSRIERFHRPSKIISGKEICGKEEPLKEVKVLKNPDLGIFDSPGEKAMHVATYAQALAVFQRTCDPLAGSGSCKKKRHIVLKGSAQTTVTKSRV